MTNASPATRKLAYLTSTVTLAILCIGAITLWQTVGARASSDQIRETALTAACRSELRSVVDLATAAVDETDGARDAIILDGLIAVALEDDAALAGLVQRAQESQVAAQDALDELHDAVDSYADGVALSRTDPEQFVALCRRTS